MAVLLAADAGLDPERFRQAAENALVRIENQLGSVTHAVGKLKALALELSQATDEEEGGADGQA